MTLKRMVSEHKGLLTVITTIVTILGSTVASVITYVGTTNQANANLVSSLLKDNQIQEKQVVELRAELLRLQLEVKEKYESSEVLRDVLDAMPFPAWVKLVYEEDEKIVFRMWHINVQYANEYNVTQAFYEGKQDNEVWPDDIAESFRRNDLFVFNRLAHRCHPETFPQDSAAPVSKFNPLVEGYVCKFTANIENRTAVVGMAIKTNKVKQ